MSPAEFVKLAALLDKLHRTVVLDETARAHVQFTLEIAVEACKALGADDATEVQRIRQRLQNLYRAGILKQAP